MHKDEITPHIFANDYEFRGDGGDYTPTEGERALIEDAICGYLAVIEADDGISAALSALVEEKPVAVKALEWDGNEARSPVGCYRVQRLDDKWEPLHDGYYMLPKTGGVVSALSSIAEAKAAAQADYEQRIRSALVDVQAVEQKPMARPDWWRDEEAAEREFTDYFVRNYPGPDTIIYDPNWHAPKIFRAAKYALLATSIARPTLVPASVEGEYRQALERIANASPSAWNARTATEALNTARAIAATALSRKASDAQTVGDGSTSAAKGCAE